MKTLAELLTSQLFKPYTDKVQALDALKNIWSAAMDEWSDYCQIANYENGVLVLSVENAAWATRLRFAIPEIKKKLIGYPEFHSLVTIKCKIVPIN